MAALSLDLGSLSCIEYIAPVLFKDATWSRISRSRARCLVVSLGWVCRAGFFIPKWRRTNSTSVLSRPVLSGFWGHPPRFRTRPSGHPSFP